MIFEQHYLDCLSQASYVIGDETTGRAVVVDPRRDVSPYLASAEEHGLTIELIIETHFHADFLSGHLELADATGAQIAYGSAAETEFASRKLTDGERISLGEIGLEIWHTPGHTPESICIVVHDAGFDAPPWGVLTGDTMFIGDVGRPDLLSSKGVTADELAGELYESVHGKLLGLPDETRVYPGHGAGSSCGKSLSTETTCTMGRQRVNNYALAPMSRDEFIAVVTDGQSLPPAYFAFDAVRNREERPLLDEHEEPTTLSLEQVLGHQRRGAVVLDTRSPSAFGAGHLIGSVNVGLEGRFAEFVGGVVQPGAPIVIVADAGEERTAKNRLARIGFDHVIGALETPLIAFEANPNEVQVGSRLDVASAEDALDTVDDVQLVDVRQPGETAGGVVAGAILVPLTRLNEKLATLDASRPTIVYCAGGFRSSIAASRMRAAGFGDVSDVLGGWSAWEGAGSDRLVVPDGDPDGPAAGDGKATAHV